MALLSPLAARSAKKGGKEDGRRTGEGAVWKFGVGFSHLSCESDNDDGK